MVAEARNSGRASASKTHVAGAIHLAGTRTMTTADFTPGGYRFIPAVDFTPGGYRFIPAVFQSSGGVAALPGFEIRRVRFQRRVPLAQGFERIEKFIRDAGRPLTSFCACELRSPAPFGDAGFRAFNEIYVVTLQKWSIYDGKTNPVARS